MSGSWSGLAGMIADGGPVFVIIMILSVATLTLLLVKAWQFHVVDAFGQRGAEPVVRRVLAGGGGPTDPDLARLSGGIGDAIRAVLAGSVTAMAIAHSAVRLVRDRMRLGLRALEAMAALGPLLGLLGTVLGMIEAFTELGGGKPDPALLASGIAKALVNTAGGLVVAILASAGLAWFESVIDRRDALLDMLLMRAAAARDREATLDARR